MLTAATLGMFLYGLYSAGSGLVDLFGRFMLEIWADLGLMIFGGLLIVGAALVRVAVPGGLALAIGALLGLQALSIHNDAHLYGRVVPLLQVVRGGLAAALVLLGYVGARRVPPGR